MLDSTSALCLGPFETVKHQQNTEKCKNMALDCKKKKGRLVHSMRLELEGSVPLCDFRWEHVHQGLKHFVPSCMWTTVKVLRSLLLGYKSMLASREIHKYRTCE